MSETTERQMPACELFRRFLPYFSRYKAALVFDLACASLTTVCEIVFPLIVREVTNRAMIAPDTLTIPWVLELGFLYLILRIIDTLSAYYMQSRGHFMGARIETDMRRDLFNHLERLSFSYYNNTKIGQLMGRLTSDLFDIAEFAHHCPEEFFIGGVKIFVSFIILLRMNVGLTLLVFAMVPVMILLLRYFNRRMRLAFKECRNEVGEMNARIEDSLLGVRVVQSFANEPLEKTKFGVNNRNILNAKIRQYIAMAGFSSVTRAFEGVMYILVVVIGAVLLAVLPP